jgi:hypothetical protein
MREVFNIISMELRTYVYNFHEIHKFCIMWALVRRDH